MKGGNESPSVLVVERAEDGGDKEKKKNKRRGRRSKLNSPNLVSSSVTEVRGESLECGSGSKMKNYISSMNSSSFRQPELDVHPLTDEGMISASNVAFNSMPIMHINEQAEHLLPSEHAASTFSKSCPEPFIGGHHFETPTNKDLLPCYPSENHSQIRNFAPHLSMESVYEVLEKCDAFKALFHVNAHNRLEAYCKIDGVPTDILISGIAAQNRAVEGDIVVIKVDPFSFWTKMKGLNGQSNFASLREDCNLPLEASNCKGKNKMDSDYDCSDSGHVLLPQKGFNKGDASCSDEAFHQEVNGRMNLVNGNHLSASESSHVISSNGHNEVLDGVDKLCALISSYPSKRPTGRVVAIIEKSPRRDTIVGFLNVKQWFYYRGFCKKDAKKNKNSPLISDHEYIQLTPTDPKFPKMMVHVRRLPGCIKRRLEDGDVTVEMELVAARIDNWAEDSPLPQAYVIDIFGRGSKMESQINAILYENAICCSDFSAESLSCLPHNAWEVPPEEIQTRRDLRNLCVFTIDPSTATELDDALSVEKLSNGIVRVGVHIADVSYFVLPGTALDIEAQIRSTSVYMLQSKLPMLPPLLTENLGSLNPGVDRLAFSVFWDMNSAGDVIDRWIGHTVIRSCCKLSYEHAQYIIDEKADKTFENGLSQLYGNFEWPDIFKSVKSLYEISKILRERRINDGALRLESSKIVFLFDECGIPYDSRLCERKDSNFLVEEFMLLANRTAAEVICRTFPDSALLRRHPEPNMRKLKEFEAFCCRHGLELDSSSSGHFHRSLECIREKLKDDQTLFDILISYASRPMQLATYFCSGDLKDNVNNWGHYALAVPVYTHFTSPLRRYPDIVVHRTLAAAVEAEELYLKHRRISLKGRRGEKVIRCFTGIYFDEDAVKSMEGKGALSAAALKYQVPSTELLADVAAYCNERKLATRHVKDACDKLYMWVLLKKREVLLSEARVLGLGPRFMSIYIEKLAIERRIYYDEVEGLAVEWLEATSTLVLNLSAHKRSSKKPGSIYCKPLDDVAWVINPYNLKGESYVNESVAAGFDSTDITRQHSDIFPKLEIEPEVFPITIRLLSTIPVALHAVGGDDGPLDIGVRLFMSSYFI